MKYIFYCFLFFIFCFLLFTLFTNCHYFVAAIKYPPKDTDYKRLKVKKISKSETPFFFKKSLDYKIENIVFDDQDAKIDLNQFLTKTKTNVFLVISNDTIVYEYYSEGYDKSDLIMTWSITKTFVGSLVNIALKEGYIGSIQDSLIKYIPELKDQIESNVKLIDLLNMKSGINYCKCDFKLGPYLSVHYGKNLFEYAKKAKSVIPPGQKFQYSQIDLILLAIVLRRATGRPLYDYLQEKIWMPLGMEYDAYWAVDDTELALERAASGLFAAPEDIAKLGRLYLNHGMLNNNEILTSEWATNSVYPSKNFPKDHMVYLWRHTLIPKINTSEKTYNLPDSLILGKENHAYANGANNNKLLFLVPEKKIMILRFGPGMKDIKVRDAIASFANRL